MVSAKRFDTVPLVLTLEAFAFNRERLAAGRYVLALIDTGSTITCVRKDFAFRDLQLSPSGQKKDVCLPGISGPGETEAAETVSFEIALPASGGDSDNEDEVREPILALILNDFNLKDVSDEIREDIGILLGMDFLSGFHWSYIVGRVGAEFQVCNPP